jgi:hypothetical protein
MDRANRQPVARPSGRVRPLEHRLQAVSRLGESRCFQTAFRCRFGSAGHGIRHGRRHHRQEPAQPGSTATDKAQTYGPPRLQAISAPDLSSRAACAGPARPPSRVRAGMLRIWFISEVLWPTSRSRTRCRTCTSSCAPVLSATNRNGGAGRSLSDRLRVPVIVLLRLDVGTHVLGRHQPYLMPLRHQKATEVVRAAACRHRHDATGQLGRERNDALPPHPATARPAPPRPSQPRCSCSCPSRPQESERPSCRPSACSPDQDGGEGRAIP